MYKFYKYFVLIALLGFFACKPTVEDELKRIKGLEKAFYSDKSKTFDIEKAKELANSYNLFAQNFPADTNAVNFLFKASELFVNSNEPQKSINNLDTIINRYPNYKNMANVYFLKGFIYDSQIKDISKAKSNYQIFIQKFPYHPLVKDANACIRNLGKSDEEIIKEFEEMNRFKQDSIAKNLKK